MACMTGEVKKCVVGLHSRNAKYVCYTGDLICNSENCEIQGSICWACCLKSLAALRFSVNIITCGFISQPGCQL